MTSELFKTPEISDLLDRVSGLDQPGGNPIAFRGKPQVEHLPVELDRPLKIADAHEYRLDAQLHSCPTVAWLWVEPIDAVHLVLRHGASRRDFSPVSSPAVPGRPARASTMRPSACACPRESAGHPPDCPTFKPIIRRGVGPIGATGGPGRIPGVPPAWGSHHRDVTRLTTSRPLDRRVL